MNNLGLRKQFEDETGKGSEIPSFSNEPRTFTLAYVLWLEKQVLAVKNCDIPPVIKSVCPINSSIDIEKCIYRGEKCSVCIK